MKDKSDFGGLLFLPAGSKGFKTRRALAKLLGKHQSEISTLETGETPPTVEFIFLCAEKLQLKPLEFHTLLKLGFHDMEKISFEKQSIGSILQDTFITFLAGALAYKRPNPQGFTMNCKGVFVLEEQIAKAAKKLWEKG